MAVASAGEVGSVWVDSYCQFINDVKKAVGEEVKVGASVIGRARDVTSWDSSFDIFKESTADFIEFDCDHPRYFRDPEYMPQVIQRAKEKLSIPITVKLPPFLSFPLETAKMVIDAGADAIAMFDLAVVLDFDINGLKLPFWNTWCYFPAGVSLPYTNFWIVQSRLGGITAPISASMGVWEWEDVIKCIMSGADAVQVCRKIMVRGYQEATAWLQKVNSWLDENNYASIRELKGNILERLASDYRRDIPREEPLELGSVPSLKAVVDEEKCQGCTDWCTRACGYSAITAKDDKASIAESRCAGCGTCEGACPFEAISLQPRTV
jgi:dihydroorotate dehydrogenase (fumarate)/dihydropyrimidine dehydrogenase (NAD+) subunit PreA